MARRMTRSKIKGGIMGFPAAPTMVVFLLMVQNPLTVTAEEWSPTVNEQTRQLFGDPFQNAMQTLASIKGHKSMYGADGRADDDLVRYYLPSPDTAGNITQKCRDDVATILKAFTDEDTRNAIFKEEHYWPILLPDSWGKMNDGIFSGNFIIPGMMEECTGIHVNEKIGNILTPVHVDAHFSGKYCMIYWSPYGDPMHPEVEVAVARMVKNPHLRSGQLPNVFLGGGPSYGTCMPDSCSPEDFKTSLEEVLQEGSEVWGVHCHTKDETPDWEGKDYAFVIVFGILCFLVVLGAAVDLTINYLGKQEMRKGPAKYILAFSGYSNMSKLFYINTKENPNNISCLHGIRVLSMTWVVWGHQSSNFLFTTNPLDVARLFDNVIGQVLLNAQLSVDSFFYLSGLLVGFGLMKNKNKMDLFNFFMFYLHRFLRLAPPIAMMGFFSATVARFFLTGIVGELEKIYLTPCSEAWLYDTLFVNNLNEKYCLGQCWYTSVDMQIYVLVPLLFFPLMYYGTIGGAWLMFMTVVSCVIPAVISDLKEYGLSWMMFDDPAKQNPFFFWLYSGTWARMTPYIVGLWTGYFIHRINKKTIKMELWQVTLGWITASIVGLLVVFGVYPYNHWNPDWSVDRWPDQGLSDIYNGLFRGAWGLALMWVVVACHTGYGGPVQSFLGHPTWQPLSRLTYGIFLTHITVMTLIQGSQYRFKSYTYILEIVETCGLLFISGIAAVILNLVVDCPIIGLEKLLFHRQGTEPKPKTAEKES